MYVRILKAYKCNDGMGEVKAGGENDGMGEVTAIR